MRLSTLLSRWTLWLWLNPHWFLEPHSRWESVALEHWAENYYNWTEDPEAGAHDYVRNPWRTYMTGEGDCEDFAVVVMNVLWTTTDLPITLGFCGTGARPKHVVISDGTNVYSSGRVFRGVDLATYLDYSSYEWMIERRVR